MPVMAAGYFSVGNNHHQERLIKEIGVLSTRYMLILKLIHPEPLFRSYQVAGINEDNTMSSAHYDYYGATSTSTSTSATISYTLSRQNPRDPNLNKLRSKSRQTSTQEPEAGVFDPLYTPKNCEGLGRVRKEGWAWDGALQLRVYVLEVDDVVDLVWVGGN